MIRFITAAHSNMGCWIDLDTLSDLYKKNVFYNDKYYENQDSQFASLLEGKEVLILDNWYVSN